jgi:hypothetical protein
MGHARRLAMPISSLADCHPPRDVHGIFACLEDTREPVHGMMAASGWLPRTALLQGSCGLEGTGGCGYGRRGTKEGDSSVVGKGNYRVN